MNPLISELRYNSPEKLLSKYNIPLQPPINVDYLFERIGILKISFDFTKIENILGKPNGSVMGAIYQSESNIGIFYRTSDNRNTQRFVLVKCLARCCLYEDIALGNYYLECSSIENSLEDPTEKIITDYAEKLLIPREVLMDIHKRIYIAPKISDLANFFQVPIPVMMDRLEKLQLSYLKDCGFST